MRRRVERGGVLGVLLLVVAALVAVMLIGVTEVAREIGREFRVEHRTSRDGEAVKVQTPVGSIRVRSHGTVSKHQIPVYPGARLEKGNKGASLEMESGHETAELMVAAAVYSTGDAESAVRDFYQKEMPHCILTRHGIECSEDGYKRIVTITRKRGKTWIAVASIGEPAAN